MPDNETAEQLLARYKKEFSDLQPYITTKPKVIERLVFLQAEIIRISGLPLPPDL